MSKVKAADAVFGEWITDRRPTEADGKYVLCSLPNLGEQISATPVWWEEVAKNGWPWMPMPNPYEPPQDPDPSLSESIDYLLDSTSHWHPKNKKKRDRIIEAARKWDVMANQGKCVQGFTASQIATKHAEPFVIEDDSDPVVENENENVHAGANSGIDRCLQPTDSGVQDIRETGNQGTGLRPDDKESANRKTERSQGLGEVHEHSLNDPDGVGEGWRLLFQGEKVQPGDQKQTSRGQWAEMVTYCNPQQWEGYKYRRRIDADKPSEAESIGFPSEFAQSVRQVADAGKPSEKPKRREWWFNGSILGHPYTSHEKAASCNDGVLHVREVLPGDPSPEWVDELVRLCETLAECWNSWVPNRDLCKEIAGHLAKRGEK